MLQYLLLHFGIGAMFVIPFTMKKILLLLFALVSISAKAQPPIYKISGNGLEHDSYLYGTIHIIDKSKFALPANMKKTIKSCELVLTEINPNTMKEETKEHAQSLLLTSGSYQQLMGQEKYEWLDSYMTDTLKIGNLMKTIYLSLKPVFLYGTLLQKSIDKSASYETEIHKMGKKKIEKGLETMAEQIEYVNELTEKEQADMIKPGFMKEFEEMSDVYISGDLDSLMTWAKNVSGETEYGKIEAKLVVNRNTKWIPLIKDEIHSHEGVFIAVGALHLPGETGVIQLLRNEGYVVEEVKEAD